ncbi:MAG: AsnC family transcriptional regulator [Nitrospinota bacterium]|nr:AsnC family transcriptional regulator [Nitrospinota bacterium]
MNPEIKKIDQDIMRCLQDNIPDSIRPYKDIADTVGLSEKEVIEKIRFYKEKGWIRRYGATLRHHNAGFKANGMGVWSVPEESEREELGAEMAGFREVSHCYERPSYEDWPYHLFTMMHGETKEEVMEIAKRISEKTGVKEYNVLFSSREFKKSSMRYFG